MFRGCQTDIDEVFGDAPPNGIGIRSYAVHQAAASVAANKGHMRTVTSTGDFADVQSVTSSQELCHIVLNKSLAGPVARGVPVDHPAITLAKVDFRHDAIVVALLRVARKSKEWRVPSIFTAEVANRVRIELLRRG